MCIINFLNEYSGALTFLITAIYVIATIVICFANYTSAKVTKEQLQESKKQLEESKNQLRESKRQYEDTKRLNMMPYLQAESASGFTDHSLKLILKDDDLNGSEFFITIRIKNIGIGTAKDIRYKWNNFTGSYDRENFPIRALQSGEGQSISISFTYPRVVADCTMASLDLTYEDLLENSYTQRLLFSFEKYPRELRFKSHVMYPPCIIDKENCHA